jgi:hypothetical protein
MKNRNIKYRISFIVSVMIIALTLVSCEKYLDKAPEATITEKDAYGNFRSFQGFVEGMYNCITDYEKAGAWNYQFNFADEVLNGYQYQFDVGNYWSQSNLFYGATANVTSNEARDKRIWPLCWYGIRKANLALSKLDLLVDATQEEKDLIKGQALFFRGWFYFELMRYWGGLPYVDTVLISTDEMKLPRLSYKEAALKAAKDFTDAAPLLPVNWNDILAGKATFGNNQQRISKVMALAYLGKDLLYAASPMMNESSTGNAVYDTELCKQAALAFAGAIKVCDETGAYKLQTWATWTDNFWVWSPGNNLMSGGTEVIMNSPVYNKNRVRNNNVSYKTPAAMGGGNADVEVPTHNYVKNYGMSNGFPIDDPLSGYNPNDPWTNREPRFYKDIIVDGDELAASSAAGVDRYAQLYNGGRHRGGGNLSVTGYYYKRWSPKGCNQWENKWANFLAYVPYLRLADVYLMYAEAVLQGYGSATASVPGSITAEAAVNLIRNRAQLPNLTSSYTATKDKFMDVIIRERAVELAFEGHRFNDLRRWNIAGENKYKEKTAIDFDRGPNGKPINLKERVVITRVFDKKHNWLPFQVNFTKIYKEFPQNPGW